MLNHGLDEPVLDQQDGFFVVTLPGPSGNYDRIRVPTNIQGTITPAMESRLNGRQKQIILHIQKDGEVTSGPCRPGTGDPVPIDPGRGVIFRQSYEVPEKSSDRFPDEPRTLCLLPARGKAGTSG